MHPFIDSTYAAHATLMDILPAVVAVYGFFSVIAFFNYARDKSAARSGQRRISEKRLLLMGLFGGWPGALLAQQTLRHKTAKRSFQLQFWISVVLNLLALGWVLVATLA
ncbi:MAG: DUF1294 domain-containing protein [Pseudomonadota bacterium]|nr:DUF1294 domain-containing protein [Pseudomonadota bacterium]